MSTENKIYAVIRETNRVSSPVGLFLTLEAAQKIWREKMLHEMTIQMGEDSDYTADTQRLLERKDDDIDVLLTEIFRSKFNSTYIIESTYLIESRQAG
jgi:hypothetical protein